MFEYLTVSGPDRHSFLQRLLSNDVRLADGQGCSAYYLNVSGRPLFHAFCFENADKTYLFFEKGWLDIGYTELDRMHFGEKLRIERGSDTCHLVVDYPGIFSWRVQKVVDGLLFGLPYLGEGSGLLLSAGACAEAMNEMDFGVQERRYRSLSIRLDEINDKVMFLEIASNQDYSETKGCYPGQEVVARTLHRGHINKKLVLLEHGSPVNIAAGDPVLRDGKEVGLILSQCPSPRLGLAFALVRRGWWDIGTELTVQQRSWTIRASKQ